MHFYLATKQRAFTLVEILIVLTLLAILAVTSFVIINPGQRIDAANDAKRREEAREILKAVELYSTQNSGSLPTAAGDPLPVVTSASIMASGAAATDLDSFTPDYLKEIPLDPSGSEYRVGVLADGQATVGTVLSDGSDYIVP